MGYEQPKAITNISEVNKVAKELGMKDVRHLRGENGCFQSMDISFQGVIVKNYVDQPDFFQNNGITVLNEDDEGQNQKWEAIGGKRIPGLRCPYCNAQAFFTDMKKVAVCGACPGWYFFYTGLEKQNDADRSQKIVMKYVNGVLQPVIEEQEGVDTSNTKI